MRVIGTLRPGLADALTIGNALCGVAAVTVVVVMPRAADVAGETAVLRVAALILLAGVVLDVCDGAVARARGGTPLGRHLDSLADAVAFGLAPAVIVGGLAMRHALPVEAIAIGVGALAYAAGAVLRLADFDAGRSRDAFFTGMPSPLAAVAALCVGFVSVSPWMTAAGLALVGWFMVSALRYPRSRGFGLVAEAVGLVVGVIGIVGLVDVRLPAAIALAIVVVVVPATYALLSRRRRAPARSAEASSDPIDHR